MQKYQMKYFKLNSVAFKKNATLTSLPIARSLFKSIDLLSDLSRSWLKIRLWGHVINIKRFLPHQSVSRLFLCMVLQEEDI